MSFNRLNYDRDAYQQELKQSVGQGNYVLATPVSDCKACFPPDNLSTHDMNSSVCLNRSLVDVSSELLGLNRKLSRAPGEKYLPDASYCQSASLKDCNALHTEDTRLSNPPITLRGTGWNRWEWLCRDPQKKALVPFDHNIANRIVAKDNHRPYIQRPIDQSAALPPMNSSDSMYEGYKSLPGDSAFTGPASTTWKAANYYEGEYNIGGSAP